MAVSMLGSVVPYVIGTFILTVVIQLIVKILKLITNYHKSSQLFRNFPGPPPHWLYGNIGDFEYGKGIFKEIEWAQKYGPAYTVHVGPILRRIVLNSPDFIKIVMKTAEPKAPLYKMIEPWIGDGLLLSKGKKWTRDRKLLTPAFHFDILKPYQKLFSETSCVMIEKWKTILKANEDASVEVFENVSLMTLDSLMKCIFGCNENFQADSCKNPYINAVYSLSKLSLQRVRFPPHLNNWIYYFSYNGYKFRKAVKVTHDYSRKVINQRRNEKEIAESAKPPKKYLDFLDILLDCRDDEGKGLSFTEIQDEVDTFMFAGHDTTASGISWCLYNLARHPEYQEKCRKEIQQILGDRNEVCWDDLSKMTYLTMCIKESLRITPPIAEIGRQSTKPLELPDGRIIPKDTWISLGIYTCHHNPKVWEDPEIYDPERFNLDTSAGRHTHSFIPFSAGPRNCIGQHFAMNELKTTIALVLKNFRLRVDGSKPVMLLPELVVRSKEGLWLKLETV